MPSITREFPDSSIGIVHQDGTELGTRHKGVTVILRIRDGEQVPCSAEVMSTNCDNQNGHYADLGLVFDGRDLIDFDGAFELPLEVATMLRDIGCTVSEDFFA